MNSDIALALGREIGWANPVPGDSTFKGDYFIITYLKFTLQNQISLNGNAKAYGEHFNIKKI